MTSCRLRCKGYYGDVGGPPRIGAACPSDPIDCLQHPSNLMCKGPLSLDTLMHSFQMGIGNQLHQLACCCWSTCSQPFSLVVRSWESAAQLLWRTKCFNPSWTLGVRQPTWLRQSLLFLFPGMPTGHFMLFVVWKLRQALRGFGSNFGAKWAWHSGTAACMAR